MQWDNFKVLMKDHMRHPLLITCALMIALVVGCQSPPKPPQRIFPVKVSEVVQREVPIYFEIIGNVISPQVVQLRPQITGMLIEAHVKQGQDVTEGQLLYSIDPAPFKATLDRAKAILTKDQAQLDFSKKKVERYEALKEKDYVSALSYEQYQTDVLTITSQVASDQADVDAAAINLAYTEIRSPMTGRISSYLVDPGNVISPSNILTEIRQIDPIDIQFSLSQRDFQRLQDRFAGQTMDFDILIPNVKEPLAGGKVFFVDNHLSLATGTVLVKGRIDNAARTLWPGLFVRVRLLLENEPHGLLVPVAAVQFGQQGPYVYVLKDDQTVELRRVTLGETVDEQRLIKSGLKAGETVVTDGQLNLSPGVKVQVTQ